MPPSSGQRGTGSRLTSHGAVGTKLGGKFFVLGPVNRDRGKISGCVPGKPSRSSSVLWSSPETHYPWPVCSSSYSSPPNPVDYLGRWVGSPFEAPCSVAGGDVEHHHAHHDQGYAEDVYRPQDLLPDHQPQEDRAHRSEPRPYGVCHPQRDVLQALGQEVEGQGVPDYRQDGRAWPPEPFRGLE